MDLQIIKKDVPVVACDMADMKAAYAEIAAAMEEVGGAPVFRAKIPSGGGKAFTIETGDEDSDTAVTAIQGVVIHSHKCNARFDESQLGEPPLCSSMDGKIGVNAQTGEACGCLDCPYNEYGSSAKGPGKACKNMIRVYMIVEGSPIPLLISLPPTSMKNWQAYRISTLAAKGLKPCDVVTELTLTSATNKAGIKYSVIKPRLIGKLSPEDAEAARFFAAGFAPKVEISAEDYNTKEAENDAGERAAE